MDSRPAVTSVRRALVADVRLYLIADATIGGGAPERFLPAVIEAGVGMVQLRDKQLSDRELLRAARAFARTCRESGGLFVVNDRVDIALAAGADGVHVGQDDVHPDDVRRIAGGDFIVGVSTHSAEQVDAAGATSADYIGVGPVHATPTKPGAAPVGVELVRYAAAHARIPFFAIGGIDARTARDVAAAGARSLSVMRAVTGASDPAHAVRAILAAMDS